MRHRERGRGAQIGRKRDGSRRGIGIAIGLENAERGHGRAVSNKTTPLHIRAMGEVRKNQIRYLRPEILRQHLRKNQIRYLLPEILRQHLLPRSPASCLKLRFQEEMQMRLNSGDREKENGVGGEGRDSSRKCRYFADESTVPLGPQLSMLLRLTNERQRFARRKEIIPSATSLHHSETFD